MKVVPLILLFWVLSACLAIAQEASIQDCLGAIPVCQKVYVENQAPVGLGRIMDFNPDAVCLPVENNSIWYTFTVNRSGKFGFLLTPANPEIDYDWVLFDLTNATCTDLLTDPSLVVSCNAAGKDNCNGPTGATGATPYHEQGANCGNMPPDINAGFSPFNDLIDVQAGNTYVLCITNFTGSTDGYTLDFGLSTDIGIFDEIPPAIRKVSYPQSCNGQEMMVQFTEYIQCASISKDNFRISGPDGLHTVQTLTGTNCSTGGNFSKFFLLNINPPVAPQENIQLELVVGGSDQVLDLCGNPAVPVSLERGGPTLTEKLDLGPDTAICVGLPLILGSDLPGSYRWSDGSVNPVLEVTTPGAYALTINTACGATSDTIVVSASEFSLAGVDLGPDTAICASGTLLLDATAPAATYLWQDGSSGATFTVSQAGLYSVTVSNECGTVQDQINVSLAEPIRASMKGATLCPGERVTWDVTTAGASYLWQDGSTSPEFTAAGPGVYAVTITTPCEKATLTAEIEQTAPELPPVDLGPDTVICPSGTLLLDAAAPSVTYLWQDGSTGPSLVVTTAGLYAVTVSNTCDSRSDEIMVEVTQAIVLEVTRDTFVCPGESLTLEARAENATYYLWPDGSRQSSFRVDAPGTYQVLAGNICEEQMASIRVEDCDRCSVYVPNAISPNGDGMNDAFQPYSDCPLENYRLRIFNRWGNLIFETKVPEDGWKGSFNNQDVESGVYIYMMQLDIEENGVLKNMELAGSITVIK